MSVNTIVDRRLRQIQSTLEALQVDVRAIAAAAPSSARRASAAAVSLMPVSTGFSGFSDPPAVISPTPPAKQSDAPAAAKENAGVSPRVGGRAAMLFKEEPTESVGRRAVAGAGGSGKDNTHTMEKMSGLTKKASAVAQAKRDEYFKHLNHNGPWDSIPRAKGVNCVWLGCAALALSFATSKTTSMESILKVNNMPLHFVSFASITLAELYDTINDYLAAGPADQLSGVRCEIATFDSLTLEDNTYEIGFGERSPITSLAMLRKELTAAFSKDARQMHIFNFDPFVVQEEEFSEDFETEDDNEESNASSPVKTAKKQWAEKNMGQFALLLQFSPALGTVVLATPHLQPDGTYALEEHTCSLQTLYQATCACDGYTKKPRGFVKIIDDGSRKGTKEVASVCALDVVDGRSTGGLRSIALDVAICPHILGLGIYHQIVTSIVVKEPARQKLLLRDALASGLLGIPVSNICRVLDLPVDSIVGLSDRQSVATAFAWYSTYLERIGIADAVHTYFVPVTRKGGAEDGCISVPVESFLEHVSAAVKSLSVMLVSFDVAQALNVGQDDTAASSSASTSRCNFAVVIGVDEEAGIVRLADVNVKKYRKTWHCPLVRLHAAVADYGYMVVASSPIDCLDRYGKPSKNLLKQSRFQLPPAMVVVQRFEYPKKSYSMTVLADALEQLGFPNVTVESVMYNAGFHISFLLSEHIPLHDLHRIGTFFSATKLDGKVGFAVKCFDPDRTTLEGFAEMVAQAMRAVATKRLLVSFDAPTIQKAPNAWNGSATGGSLCIVVGYDPASKIVTVQDCNHNRYFRVWQCPLDILFAAVSKVDKISTRARGILWVDKEQTSRIDVYDMRQAMVSHPFKPALSGGRCACALGISVLLQRPVGVEDLVYGTGGFNLSAFAAKESSVEAFVASIQFPNVTVTLIPTPTAGDFRNALSQASARTIIVLLYDAVGVHGVDAPGFSGGLLAEVTKDTVRVVEGNPTTFGSGWTTGIDSLAKATVGVLRLTSN